MRTTVVLAGVTALLSCGLGFAAPTAPASAALATSSAASPGAVCPTSYAGTKYGTSVSDASDWQRDSALIGRNMCTARVFFPTSLPADLAANGLVASLPSNAVVVFSWKSGMTAAEVTASLKSRPAGMVCYAAYYHEPEDNFTTAAQQSSYRASWGVYGPAIRAAGCTPTLILMRYTLNPNSGRDWHAWSNASAYDVNGWDAYNSSWDNTPGAYLDPQTILGPIQTVSAQNGKDFLIAETGSPIAKGSTAAARATWAGQLARAYSAAGARLALWWDQGAATSFDNTLDAASGANWNATGAPK